MRVEHVDVLVEEPSMAALLGFLLPKILGSTTFRIYPHQCKDELLKHLPERLRGYARWIKPTWRIVVAVDRDNDDCHELKYKLEQMALDAGLVTRSQAHGRSYAIVNRLVIEELEAWYFGDWEAVRAAYPRVPTTVPSKAKYRNPDTIVGGTWEAFEGVLQKAGYFKGGLRKIEAANTIGPYMAPERNCSTSFRVLQKALLDMGFE